MKKLVSILILLSITLLLNAQPIMMRVNATEEEKAFFETRDSLFAPFELDKVATGFLKEFGIFFEDPTLYNGNNPDSPLNSSSWGYLLAGMRSATVNHKAINIPFYRDLKPVFEEKAKSENMVFLPLLFLEYNQFDPAIVNVSEKKVEKTDSKESVLYLSDTLFAVSPSVKEVQSLNIVFQLSSEYLFSNLKINKTTYIADFDDGQGEITINPDEQLNVKYSKSGKKQIKITAIDQSGHVLTCYSTIEIAPETNDETSVNLKSVITSTTGSVTGRAYNGETATIDYEIVYSGSDQILDKPFIMVEGFDPLDNWTFADDWGGFSSFRYSLLYQGYDLILVNYQNSMDYIQRNAYALEELIKNVNQTKNQYCLQKRKNVIMGLSMGGLVTRYALRDMENLGYDHDTRLYISYDSPQQGANIPLSFQKLVERLDDYWLLNALGFFNFFDISQLEEAYDILKSPAAQQMLVLGGSLHNSFYNELGTMGFPSCRNIALANGSMQSVLYPSIQYGGSLAELDVYPIGGIVSYIGADCYALANNSSSLIYKDNFGISSWYWGYAQSIPFDNAPGGTYDYANFHLDAQEISNLLPGNNSQLNLSSDGFCFVPTASALGITLNSSTLQASVTNVGQTPFDNIFINNTSNNENHIQLTTAKKNWILQQVAIGDVFDCDGSCFSITGPTNLCSSGGQYSVLNVPSGSYVNWSYSSNIQSYYGGNNWIALRSIGNGAGWVEATITNTNCGNITLPRMTVWAGIPTAYGFYTEVNGEEVEYYETALICPNITSCLDAWPEVEEMSTTNYTWHLPSWYSGNGSFGSNGICFNPNGTIGSSITADVTNSCGTGYGVLQIYFGNNGCRSSYQYAISPNPASTELTVEQLTAEEAVGRGVLEPAEVYDLSDTKDADDGSYTLEIWHEKKGKVRAVNSKNKKEVIDVSGLEKGAYILHIRTKQALYQEHILVK